MEMKNVLDRYCYHNKIHGWLTITVFEDRNHEVFAEFEAEDGSKWYSN